MRVGSELLAPLPRRTHRTLVRTNLRVHHPLKLRVARIVARLSAAPERLAAGSRRERRRFGKLGCEPFRFASLRARLRRVWSFIQIAGRFGAGRIVAVGSAEPPFVRAVVQVLACDVRASGVRVCERLAGVAPDRVDRRGRRRGRRVLARRRAGPRLSRARRARRRCRRRCSRSLLVLALAARARDPDAAAAGELRRGAASTRRRSMLYGDGGIRGCSRRSTALSARALPQLKSNFNVSSSRSRATWSSCRRSSRCPRRGRSRTSATRC